MLEGTDLKLAVALKKSGKVKWSVIQEGENALDRGDAKNLREWLAAEGHLEPFEADAIMGGGSPAPPEQEEPAEDPDRVVVSSPAELLALLQKRKEEAEQPEPEPAAAPAASTGTGVGIARTPKFGTSAPAPSSDENDEDDGEADAPKRKFGGSKSFGETFGAI